MEKPKRIIFYSWQSDLDSKTTRSFIEDALKRAVKALKRDDTLDVISQSRTLCYLFFVLDS